MTSPARRFAFILTSARRDGNTETLARKAAEHLPPGSSQEWLNLIDLPLPPFEDIRHGSAHYTQPTGNERVLFDATLGCTDLVLVVPLYWYSLPASAKLYLDYWSAWLRVPPGDFRQRMAGKTLWGVSVISDKDQRCADPLVGTLSITADYLKMPFGGVLMGYGNKPGEVLADTAALDRAQSFFRQAPRPPSAG